MLLAGLSLATCARAQLPLAYERIASSSPSDPIEFVHVEREQGELRLGVYAHRRQLASWIAGQGPSGDALLTLGRREWFFLSTDRRRLGVRAFQLRPGDPPGSPRETSLRFPRENDLSAVPARLGPHVVRVSDDGHTLLQSPPRGEGPSPTTVRILRRSGPPPAPFGEIASYTVDHPGSVQMSRTGNVIAHQDGTDIRLLDGAGIERARVPAGTGFDLGPGGGVLAVRDGSEVLFLRLDQASPVPGAPFAVALSGPVLGVELAGPLALVRSRSELALVRWPARVVAWRRNAAEGTYTSADLSTGGPGELRIVAGRLEVLSAPRRSTGSIVWGQAKAFVDVLDRDGRAAFQTHSFPTSRWTHVEPRVRLVGGGARVLVRTGDVALLSEPLQ